MLRLIRYVQELIRRSKGSGGTSCVLYRLDLGHSIVNNGCVGDHDVSRMQTEVVALDDSSDRIFNNEAAVTP